MTLLGTSAALHDCTCYAFLEQRGVLVKIARRLLRRWEPIILVKQNTHKINYVNKCMSYFFLFFLLFFLKELFAVSSVQDGIVLGKAHMRSTPSLGISRNGSNVHLIHNGPLSSSQGRSSSASSLFAAVCLMFYTGNLIHLHL